MTSDTCFASKFIQVTHRLAAKEMHFDNTVAFLSDVDLTQVERLRSNTDSGIKLSYTAFIVKALGMALARYPYANRRLFKLPLLPARLQSFAAADVAVAVEHDQAGEELATSIEVLRDVHKLPLEDITLRLKGFGAEKSETRRNWETYSALVKHLPSWLAVLMVCSVRFRPKLWTRYRGAAALVSSPAKYGVGVVIGTWPWPVGVSFGYVQPKALVKDGKIVAAPVVTVTMNWDRRVMAGAPAARFFKYFTDCLTNAESELVSEKEDFKAPLHTQHLCAAPPLN